MTINLLVFFLLQVSAKDFNFSSKQTSPTQVIIILVIIVVVVVALVIANSRNAPTGKGTSGGGSGSVGGSRGGIFTLINFHRIARSFGLDSEQTKMLDYIFKMDQVTDPEKSINNPELLDRHFRKTFRILDQNETENEHKLAVLFSTRNIIENSVLDILNSTRQIKEETRFTVIYNKDKLYLNVHFNKRRFY